MWQRGKLDWLLVLALFICSTSAAVWAQVSTATVNGSVHDTSGAVVPSATVRVISKETAIVHETTTNGAGFYTLVSLTPGSYRLEASASGFSTVKLPDLTLTVGQVLTQDFTLSVGAENTVVNVQASAAQLETSTANLGTVIGNKQVTDLPLNGRNFTQLLQLTPGVSPVNVSQNSGGGFAGPPVAYGATISFPSVQGQTNRSNYYLTDGLGNTATMLSTYNVPPIIDAIQEFKVVSHTDSAEYGGALGGIVNVSTQSGTSSIHGSAWEFARNNIFDASPYFISSGSKKPDFKQNQFGAVAGGPFYIPHLYTKRDKTFVFGGYQGFRYNLTGTNNFRVPTEANLNGDLSDQGVTIYDPYSTKKDPVTGNLVRSAFPNANVASRLDPKMVALARFLFPAAGASIGNTLNNATDTTPLIQNQNEWSIRADHTFNTKNSVWFRFSHTSSDQSSSGGLPGLISTTLTPASNWGGSYVHVFSPTLVAQVQYGRNTGAHQNRVRWNKDVSSIISTVGFDPAFVGGFQAVSGGNLLPYIGIDGFGSGGESVNGQNVVVNSHEVTGTVTKNLGNHVLQFGAGYVSVGFEAVLGSNSASFSTVETQQVGSGSGGSSLASFLINAPHHGERRNVLETERPGGVFHVFAQDSWKLTPKLNVNYGLRYDLTFVPPYGTEKTIGQNGGIETGEIDYTTGTYVIQKLPPTCAARGYAPCLPSATLPAHVRVDPRGKIPFNDYTNIGPRVGFAYSPNQSTVIRGGFGMVYENFAGATQRGQNIEGSWPDTGQQIADDVNSVNKSLTPTVGVQNPIGGGTSLPPATPFETGGYFFDPHMKNPYSEQYNLGVGHQFKSNTSVTLNYVGSTSHRLDVGGYYNTALTPGPGDPRQRSLYPYIIATNFDRSVGYSNYNAMQLAVDRQMGNNLAYNVSYTWSKNMSVATDGLFGVEGGIPSDPYHPAANGDYSVSSLDLRHILAINTIYQIPVGRGMKYSTGNSFFDYVLGNWQVNNIFTAHPGQHYTISISADQANTGNQGGSQHADRVLSDPYANRPAGKAFNPAAFAIPALYTFGNSGRNSMTAPTYWNLDTSLFRKFPFGEKYSTEIRVEAFNLFNTAILGTPNGRVDDGAFGVTSITANSSRVMQLGAKFKF